MSLDDKLKEILGKQGAGASDETIPQIKQAFADEAGLTQLIQDTANLYANMKHDALRLGLSYSNTQYLSGQEWYDNFEKEYDQLDDTRTGGELSHWKAYIFQAAKRAAGLHE